MSSIIASSGGGTAGAVTATISATTSNGTITTSETTGLATIPAGALWVKIKNAGAVVSGDLPNSATIEGGSWKVGREEKWTATFDVNAGDYIKLPEININANGARVYYTYFS